ncbi:peptide deformylase [Salinibius halmophilus]|uniref:peptide deformylase n=1 Tax=Salinibius halmophilus TaxID=1853216 RepID=UPI000E675FC6|nr:peptide deformylase [Salinibius halmophilus]
MAKLEILEFPDPRLRTVAKPVEKVDDRIRKLTEDMLETMYESDGVGLAATQVNVHERVIVIDVSETRDQPLVLINPEFEEIGEKIKWQEGCLSVPTFYEEVDRVDRIKLKALNADGEEYEMECDGLLAVCVQHECDHLAGKLFVDYLSGLKRNRIKSKMEKMHRAQKRQA